MDLGARWDKIVHDIWDNKARSLLVVFTLAIGIAFVGMIHNTVRIVKRDLYGGYASTNPASVVFYVSPFQKELASAVAAMREVDQAEASRVAGASIFDQQGERHLLQMQVVPDYSQVQIDRFHVKSGGRAPGLRQILLEQNTADSLKISIGDTLTVETDKGERHTLTVAGIVHDMSTAHYGFSGEALGYVSMATLEWMGEGSYYNQIKLTVAEDRTSREHVLSVAGLARDRVIQPAGYQVQGISISNPDGIPGDYWAKSQVDGMLLILQVMSVLAILLSAGLVINTISAVIVQQTRQIGVMRSFGASRQQIIRLYTGYVLVLSILGLLLALPLGLLGAGVISVIAARIVNFDLGPLDLPASILLIQVGLALVIPLCTAMFPILRGTRLSVYDAIYQYGLISGENKRGWLEERLVRIRNIHPPVMMSLRNTFRNKPRLGFTLATLTIAGAMFMAVFSSYYTLQSQIKELARYIRFDASISIPGGANRYTVEREALRIPDVRFAEGWALANGYIVHPGGDEGDLIEFVGLPENSRTIQPRIVAGRWLLPGDTEQVVMNEDLLAKEKDLQVGERIEVKINGVSRQLEVVGIASKHMMGPRIYMNEAHLAKLTGRYNQVDTVRVLATPEGLGNTQQQSEIGKELEKRFEDARLSESSSKTREQIFSAMANAFKILLFVLLLVAVILAVIGGLGLTGTMGLNVLERSREIGVLRAVGASHFSIRQVVVVEGVVVALISWLLSALISYPLGRLLAQVLIHTAFGTEASFKYSTPGLFTWMGIVVLIGVIASLAPAREAARLTVREVLSYE